MNKKGIEFSFAWLFAILVGAAILVAAIYFTLGVADTSKKNVDTSTAFEVTGLLRPAQSGIDVGKSSLIKLAQDTKLTFSCKLEGDFGEQRLATSVNAAIGKTSDGIESKAKDIYVFSDKQINGKELRVISLGFSFPYDIANILIVYNKNYCFVNAPDYVKEELDRLGVNDSIKLAFSKSSCAASSVKVCFSEETCDINVDIVGSFVKKGNQRLYYYDNLLYGAIFGDSQTYECQVYRIIKRTAAIASLYSSKSEIVRGE